MNLLTDGSESTEPIIEPREDSTNSLPDEVIIREWSPGDVNYIMATWLRGAHVEYNGVLPDTLWYDAHRKFIELVTSNRHCIIKIMAAAEDPATIVGYAVASNGVLLWIHMRPQFRQRGLARRLIVELGSPQIAAFNSLQLKIRLPQIPFKGRESRRLMGLH